MTEVTRRSSANENTQRLSLQADALHPAAHGSAAAYVYHPAGRDAPVEITVFTLSSAAGKEDWDDALARLSRSAGPVFAILAPWDDAAADAALAAGAVDCFDAQTPGQQIIYKIARQCDQAAGKVGALNELRWRYDLAANVLTLSPRLAAFFDQDAIDVDLSLERFFISLAGLSARDILNQFDTSLADPAPRRVVHLLQHAQLKEALGGVVGHEIAPGAPPMDSGRNIFGVLRPDVSAAEYVAASTPKSALQEDQLRGILAGYLTSQQKRMGLSAGVCVLSIDRFEQMNVLLGRQLADDLLDVIAARLKTILTQFEAAREEGDDRATALGRLGGAQFAIALEGPVLVKEASALATQILSAFRAPFTFGDQRLYLDARVGISMAGAGEQSADTVLSRANIALYQAFKDPPGSFRVFNASLAAQAQGRVILDAELRDALSQDNLFIRYMPIVDLQNGGAVGVEALVRWNHPEMGLLSPELFIPMAEESGVIADVGGWVLQHALQEFAHAAPNLPPDFHLAVNVSSEQFRRGDLAQTVVNQLYAAGLDERRLTLEITETLVIENFEHARSIMTALQAKGIRWSIDDFGTGFSALSYLSKLPFDEIKLDRSFVKALAEDGAADMPSTLVDAVIAIARSHKSVLVAEGIETRAQADTLKARGCDFGQGYCFSEPLSIHDLVGFVAAHGS